ncbi:MAG TPA: amino acid adenylation domain-containing protein [Kofleriaceae bacterium]|nr:amino acid adenylation domain-containing protein [Kofleriaceae bacterium]
MSGCGIRASTLQELLRARSSDAGRYSFLVDGERDEATLSFAELHARAAAIGAELERRGLAGERALLIYPPGLEYVCGFFGCLFAPAIAVPTYPPDPARLERSVRRLLAIVDDARPAVALTTAAVLAALQPLFALAPGLQRLQWIATDSLAPASEPDPPPDVSPDSVAFLQYTSGSTGTPKGVELTHRNLLHNSARIHAAFGVTRASRGVIWLPPYHDMGLIGGILQPLYGGFDVVLMSPLAFLERPMRWLEAVSRAGATTSGGPNFAYDLCVRKSSPAERAALDLSRWQLAFNGAEPVRAETMAGFAEAFAPAGFRIEAFFPCYGLAESTLIATGGPRLTPPRVLRLRRDELQRGRAVESSAEGAVALVGCGRAFDDGPIAIADPASGRRCADGEVGEIWLAGDSVARGYLGRPDETAAIFGARIGGAAERFLRTGDLGFLRGGELYVAGRLKDLIIVRGRNHHPSDLERTAEANSPAIRPGCAAAFQLGIDDSRVALVAELARRGPTDDAGEVCRAIRRAVAEEHELRLHAVVLVRAGSVPKTSSGKIERHACRQAYLDGSLAELARSEVGRREGGDEAGDEADEAAAEKAPDAAEVLAAGGGEILRRYLAAHLARLLRVPAADTADLTAPVTSMGLDSLMALELQALVEGELGAQVPAVDLLAGASLEEIASRVEQQLGAPAARPAPASDAEEYPLSIGQRALWFVQLLAPDSAAYNLWVAARSDAAVDPDAARAACQRLADRHPSLHATVSLRDGVPWQRVSPRPVDFEIVDAAGLDDGDLRAAMTAEAHRPFDLSAGVFRARLYRRGRGSALLFVAHHIAVDLWSAGLLMSELAGEEVGPSLPFSEHAADQAAWPASSRGAAALAYWRDRLSGPLPALELPLDRSRPRRQSFRGAATSFALDSAAGRVRQLARAEATTPYAVLLSAFAVLLHRLSGQEDLLIGSPTAGRRHGFERTVGYFINPVVIRADLAGQPSFRQLVRRTRASVLGALEHGDLPFPTLVERLPGARPLAGLLDRPPLFQALFALERAHTNPGLTPFLTGGSARVDVGGAALEPMSLDQRASAFDLALVLIEDGDRLHGSLRHDSALWSDGTAARWSRQFATLLSALLDDPDRRIADAPLDGEAERRRCLTEWNRPEPESIGQPLFHQLVEEQARQRPDATAVVIEGRTLSYRELDRRSGEIAASLRGLGVGPEQPVAVLLERSLDAPAAVLGALGSGGVYLPLDPTLPDERLRFMLADSGAVAAVTVRALAPRLGGLPALCLDEPAPAPDFSPPRQSADGAAYIIYTSGSTGRPKGVVVSHRSACNLAAAQRVFAVTHDCRVLQYASCAFDASFFELSLALTAGAALHLVPERCVLPGPDLVRLLREGAVTTVTMPPGVLGVLPADQLPAIHTVIAAGEACPAEVVARWGERRFFNAYGPTEATVWSTVARLGPGRDPTSTERPPIGAPVAGVRAYVLDRAHRPAPIGAAGELYLGGVSIARGYAGRADLTAERFLPDPFGPPGGRLYRTGDLARWLDDGSIDFLGRADDQVKVRGFRIEPGEIEAALRSQDGIGDAAVVARADRRGENRLVAYLAPAGPRSQLPPIDQLRARLRQRGLPDHLLPAAVVHLAALPRTPSGKVDRRALPPPPEPAGSEPFTAPAGELEELLVGVFREVLGHEQIGAHDHFFEVLGGNSLAVVRACALLGERAQLEVEVTAIFEHPTIHALARHLSGSRAAPSDAPSHQQRAEARAAAMRRRGRRDPGRSIPDGDPTSK